MKIFLTLVLFIYAYSASALETHFVFDVEGTLVKNIPQDQKDKSTTVPVYEVGGAAYVLRPEAISVLEQAVDHPQIKLSFVSSLGRLDRNEVSELLSQIKIKDKTLKDFTHVMMGPSQLQDGAVDLKKFGGDMRNTIFIADSGDKVVPGQESNVYTAGKLYFAFDNTSFLDEQRKVIAEHAPHLSQFVPADNSEWQKERDKWKGIHSVLREIRVGHLAGIELPKILSNLKDVEQNIRNYNPGGSIDEKIEAKWNISKGKVVNCTLWFPRLAQKIKDLTKDECVAQYGGVYKVIDKTKRKCGFYTKDGKGLIKEVEPLACFGEQGIALNTLRSEFVTLCTSAVGCNFAMAEIGGFMGSLQEIIAHIQTRGGPRDDYESVFVKLQNAIFVANERLSLAEKSLWEKNAFEITRDQVFQDLEEFTSQCQLKQYEHGVKNKNYPAALGQAVVEVTAILGEDGAEIFEASINQYTECAESHAGANPMMLKRGCPTSALITSLASFLDDTVADYVEKEVHDNEYAKKVQEETKDLLTRDGSSCQWDDSLRRFYKNGHFTKGNYDYYNQREFSKSAKEFQNCVRLAQSYLQDKIKRYKRLQQSIQQGQRAFESYLEKSFHPTLKPLSEAVNAGQRTYQACLNKELEKEDPDQDYIKIGCSRGAVLSSLAKSIQQNIFSKVASDRAEWRQKEAKDILSKSLKGCGWEASLGLVLAGGEFEAKNFRLYQTTKHDLEAGLIKCQDQIIASYAEEQLMLDNESKFFAQLKSHSVEDFSEENLKERGPRTKVFREYDNFKSALDSLLTSHIAFNNPSITQYTSNSIKRYELAKKIMDDYLRTCFNNNLGKIKKLLEYCQSKNKPRIEAYIATLITPATQAVIDDWKPYVETLRRKVYVYHWYDHQYLSSHGNDVHRMIRWYRGAWNNFDTGDGGHMGYGLYAAVDPYQSKAFGNSLVRIEIPAGTSFMDVRRFSTNYPPFKSTTVRKLTQEGCAADTSPNKAELSASEECHDILQAAIKQLNVQFIPYAWSAGSQSYCTRGGELAFYFTNFNITSSNTKKVAPSTEWNQISSGNNAKTYLFNCDHANYPEEAKK